MYPAPFHEFEYRHLRYFTLERTSQAAGETGSTIGEWTYRRHSNYGPGPTIDAELFWAACTELSLTKTRTQFHKDTSMYKSQCRRNRIEFKKPRNSENLMRFCHPEFWALRHNND